MSIHRLPKESIAQVIDCTFPCPQEVFNYRLVSRLWNAASDCPLIWHSILDREGIKITGKTDETVQELLRLFYSKKIGSNDELVERVQQFFNRCSIQQNCRFKCILKVGSGYEHLTIEIGSANRRDPNHYRMPFLNSHEIDIREDYFCINKPADCNLIKFLAPSNSCIYSLRRVGEFSAGRSFTEPSYGGAKPMEESYFQITHQWDSRAITISIPFKYVPNGERTPLINQLEFMSATKLGKPEMFTEQECFNSMMGLAFVAFGYFITNKIVP